MSTEIERLEAEIARIRAVLPTLAGMPESQSCLQTKLNERIQTLARLYGYLPLGPALPAISLTLTDTTAHISEGERHISAAAPFGEARLADLLTTARSTLFSIATDLGDGHYAQQRQGTAALCQQALRIMARTGYNLWQLIFASPELAFWARALRERGRQQSLQLNLITPGLVIPWHLIYDREVPYPEAGAWRWHQRAS